MNCKLFTAFLFLGLVVATANVARAKVVDIDQGGAATFRWAPASGPVDHYEVQVATESEPPFDWSLYRVTSASEHSISIFSQAFDSISPDLAHWAFDENGGTTVSDSSGSGHSGNVNGAQWVSDAPSGSASALKFDGVDDVVEVGAVDGSGQALTIAMWFKADDFGVSDARLISKSTGTAANAHYWMLSTTESGGSKLRFRLRTGGDTTTLVASSGTLSPGVWTHAAVVYDGSMMRIYKDGVEVGSTAKSGTLATSGSVLVAIGNQPSGAGSAPFDGAIADVRIYGEALTQADVATLAGGAASTSEWVTVRTIAYDAIGNASPPSPTSTTVHFIPTQYWSYSVPDDFDGDSIPDDLIHDTATGHVVLVESLTGDTIITPTNMGPDWEIAAQGDFDGDAREDLFWQNTQTGEHRLWLEVGEDVVEENFDTSPDLAQEDPAWEILASGDFDADGLFDLFWQNAETLETHVWFMDGATVEVIDFPRVASASWVVEASADFDGSGTYDLLWRNLDNGETAVWLMDGDLVGFQTSETAHLGLEVANVLDQNEDGSMDIIWRDTSGNCEIWLMSGGELLANPAAIGAPECPAPE